MKSNILWSMVIICLIIITAVSLAYADCFSSEQASILGGALSVLATTILGVVAMWQNREYKKLSDEMTDRMLMPELFRPQSINERLGILVPSAQNSMTYNVEGITDTTELDCGAFMIIKAPIINFRVESIKNVNDIFVFRKHSHSIFSDNSGFSLKLNVPRKWVESGGSFEMLFSYENIYGMRYEKSASFSLGQGSSNPKKWKLKQARRCN